MRSVVSDEIAVQGALLLRVVADGSRSWVKKMEVSCVIILLQIPDFQWSSPLNSSLAVFGDDGV